MQFIDRNPYRNGEAIEELNQLTKEELQKTLPQSLSDERAHCEYECTLSEVVVYLKRCGYPLENCFVSFFSPIFTAYINCGLDPLPNTIKITKEDLIEIKEGD